MTAGFPQGRFAVSRRRRKPAGTSRRSAQVSALPLRSAAGTIVRAFAHTCPGAFPGAPRGEE